MIINKLANNQMSFPIPDYEVKVAKQIIEQNEKILGRANSFIAHLNNLYDMLKAVQQPIPVEETIKNRVHLHEFKDQVVENWGKIVVESNIFIDLIAHFANTDNQIIDLVTSFRDASEDIRKQIFSFYELFKSLSAPDFKDRLIISIDNIKKQTAQFKQIISDRIDPYIKDNILAGVNLKEQKTNTKKLATDIKKLNMAKENIINKIASLK